MTYLGRLNVPAYGDCSGATASATILVTEDWIVERIAIGLNVVATTALLQVYDGVVAPENLVGQSQVGYGDVDEKFKFFPAGTNLIFKWSATGVAIRAAARVTGMRFESGTGWKYWLQFGGGQ